MTNEDKIYSLQNTEPMTCAFCGHTGTDVHRHFKYVGGRGYVGTRPYCEDGEACLERWEKNKL